MRQICKRAPDSPRCHNEIFRYDEHDCVGESVANVIEQNLDAKVTCFRVALRDSAFDCNLISCSEIRAVNSTTTMLPDELLDQLARQYPCRETQIQQLAALYSVSAHFSASPATAPLTIPVNASIPADSQCAWAHSYRKINDHTNLPLAIRYSTRDRQLSRMYNREAFAGADGCCLSRCAR